MSDKLLLVDGNSIINRAFYGIPNLTNSEGFHTNAIYGFLNIFFSVYSREKPGCILVAFDLKEPTFRHKMYAEYKGNRKPMPEELHEQVPVLKDVLHAMKIKTVELPGYEADDILGTYAHKAEEQGYEVVVLSGDRDLFQLATDKVKICIPHTKGGKTEYEDFYASNVFDKYQVTPTEFIDLKALMGDSSDNIPGIPGIGEKTASAIISKYKSLESAIEHAAEIKPKRASENLITYEEQGRMSKILATINTDSPVPYEITDGIIENESVMYNEGSYELFKKLELNRLMARFEIKDVAREDAIEYTVKPTAEFAVESIRSDKLGIFIDDKASILAVCDAEDSIVIYTDGACDNDKGVSMSQMSFNFMTAGSGIAKQANELLRSGKDIYIFGIKNALHAINAVDFSSDKIFDIEIMSYLLNPLQNNYSFDMIAKDYLSEILPSKEHLIGRSSVGSAYLVSDNVQKCMQIAAYNARTAYKAFPVLQGKLQEENMWKLFTDIETPVVYALYEMECEGIRVDKARLAEFSKKLESMAFELENEIYAEADERFNINSPMQLGVILFEKMGLPASKKTKKGYSTSADVLEKLAPEYPIVNKILKYRQITKLKSTYADGLVNFISEDGRIHGTFNQTITATGRISSTEPNLQNIPIRMELGQEIRKAFIAKEGCIFLDADYSQIELRLLAHLSGDQNLIDAYNSEADIHRITASKVFNVPFEEVTKEQRRNAKAVNFGIIYGISSFGLSQDLSISRKQASEYIKQYFETYPGVKKYLDDIVRIAKINGYVTTMFDRRRPIPELASSNFMQRSFGERVAMNSPLQGSAADIMKIAMINVAKAIKENKLRSRIVLQIHDELLVETYPEEAEQVKQILHDEMKNAAHTAVPLEVEVEEGTDWYEAH